MFCECGTWCDRMPSIRKTKMIITKNDEKGLCCSWFSAFSWFTSHTPTCLYRIYRLCDSLERRGIYTASCGPLHCLSLSCNLWSLLPVQGWFCALLSFPFMLKASSTRTQRRKSGGKRITATSSFFSPRDVRLQQLFYTCISLHSVLFVAWSTWSLFLCYLNRNEMCAPLNRPCCFSVQAATGALKWTGRAAMCRPRASPCSATGSTCWRWWPPTGWAAAAPPSSCRWWPELGRHSSPMPPSPSAYRKTHPKDSRECTQTHTRGNRNERKTFSL